MVSDKISCVMRPLCLVSVLAGLALADPPPPPTISGYSSPVQLAGSIQAPDNSYMGFSMYPFADGSTNVDPSLCARDCNDQTHYDRGHPDADCSYTPCVFFNAYVQSENGVPQGTFCVKYNATWGPAQATNYGQFRGDDQITISQSYGYSLLNAPIQPAYSSINCDSPFIKDGSFEDLSGGPPFLGSWNMTGKGYSGGMGGWSPGHESGSMFSVGLTGSNPSVTLTQILTTKPGDHYLYSMWYFFYTPSDVCAIDLTFPDSSTHQVSFAGQTPGDWYLAQTSFTGGGQEMLSINFFCNATTGGYIFIDEVAIGRLP